MCFHFRLLKKMTSSSGKAGKSGGTVQVFMNNFPTHGVKTAPHTSKRGALLREVVPFSNYKSPTLLALSGAAAVFLLNVCACENYCSFLGGPFSPRSQSQKREPINKVREQKDDSGGKYEEFNIFCY